MRALAALLLLSLGCAEVKNQARLGLAGTGSAYSNTAGQPGVSNAATGALGAAVMSRALGGCVASCPPGTLCNTETGLCDTQPCRGECRDDEICERDRCVPSILPGLIIQQKK